MCSLLSIIPTTYNDHWTFQAEITAENSYFQPKIDDLWALTLQFSSEEAAWLMIVLLIRGPEQRQI